MTVNVCALTTHVCAYDFGSLKGRLFCFFFSASEPPLEGETAIFLHGQEKIWKGLVYMQSVAKLVTKAYLVSGNFEHLKEVSGFVG